MATVLNFMPYQAKPARPAGQPLASGEVVPFRDIDLETVIETVRVLRSMDCPYLLDAFNGRLHAARLCEEVSQSARPA